MQKWEYLIYNAYSVKESPLEVIYFPKPDIEKSLESLGDAGWELITVEDHRFYFKRPTN